MNSFPLTVLLLLFLIDNLFHQWAIEGTVLFGGLARDTTTPEGGTSIFVPRLTAAFNLDYPWDTGLVILLWLWCGLRLILGDRREKGT